MTAPPATRFYALDQFPFAAELERHWQRIHQEYLGVQTELVNWVERDLYGEGWQVYGLYDFPHGHAIAANTARCPFTAELIARHIPRHGAGGFSRLRPGTRIQAHQGYQGPFLRCHLGLDVPEGDCTLQVDDETRRWANGAALIFDDRLSHAAWNLTDRARVVLLVDFIA
jgi:aspartyl/asparaginyl beta-hydroxylase (cupin superfamily)